MIVFVKPCLIYTISYAEFIVRVNQCLFTHITETRLMCCFYLYKTVSDSSSREKLRIIYDFNYSYWCTFFSLLQINKKTPFSETHIIIIMVIFSLILFGMCFTFIFNCVKKLIRDHHTIQVGFLYGLFYLLSYSYKNIQRCTLFKLIFNSRNTLILK